MAVTYTFVKLCDGCHKYFAMLFYIIIILIKSTFKKKCKTRNVCRR